MTDISNAHTAAGKPGRRLGSKNARPQVPGWHDLAEEARIQGCDERTVIRRANKGRGPKPTKFAGHPLFKDGASERYLDDLERRQEQAAEPPRRGRPRKNYGTDRGVAAAPLHARCEGEGE